MANKESKNVKRFIENISEDVATKAYEGGGGGTTVIANPELSGDEPDLTGLEVDGNKFKVPQGGGGSEYVDHITLAYGTTELTEEQIGFLLQNPYAYIVYVDTPFYPNKFNGAALGYVTQVNSHNNGASLYIESMVISTRNGAITIQKWTLATNVTPTN